MNIHKAQIAHRELIESLRWKKFQVLNDGFVCLVDVMGDDDAIVQAARVSFGNDIRNNESTHTLYQRGDKDAPESIKDSNGDITLGLCKVCGAGEIELGDRPCTNTPSNETLLRYLMRHRHTTPFEMVEIKFLVRSPMDCWRQWIRHRTANVNEYSTRYTKAIDSNQTTLPEEWRAQSSSNKQGSAGPIPTEWPEGFYLQACDENEEPYLDGVIVDGERHLHWVLYRHHLDTAGLLEPEPGEETWDEVLHVFHGYKKSECTPALLLTSTEAEFHEESKALYQLRLALGVAREQARKDLALSTYTEAYWKCDLHNILNFLSLRMDCHAQEEIRQYANQLADIVAQLFPKTWKAFEDYRLNAITLTHPEQGLIRHLNACRANYLGHPYRVAELFAHHLPNKREREEAFQKVKGFMALGLPTDFRLEDYEEKKVPQTP